MNSSNLALALAKAQSEMTSAPKTGYNPHFKSTFSTLDDLIEASRKPLTKNGLSVTQYPDSSTEDTYLVTKLKHESGEEEVSRVRIHLKDNTDIQKLGSAISYLKRYVYASICGLSASEGEDDGNSVSAPPVSKPISEPYTVSFTAKTHPEAQKSSDCISEKQKNLLLAKMNQDLDLQQQILEKYGIGYIGKLPWKYMQDVLKFIDNYDPEKRLKELNRLREEEIAKLEDY